MKRLASQLGPAIVVSLFVAAAWLLFHELKHFHLRDIRQAVVEIPLWKILAAAGLTVANYLVLIGYDYLAIRAIGRPLPLRKVALASFTGFVTSYNFGALLGGTSVRYRLYSSWGFSAVEIVQVVIMLGITFWVGALALAGAIFVACPFPIPEMFHLPFADVRPLGWLLLAISIGYLVLTAFHRAPIRVRTIRFPLPRAGTTALQLLVAAADLAIAAGCLYVLLPQSVNIGYGEFVGMYLLAVIVVVFTHVPGGLGVFELVVLKLVSTETSSSLVAALLLFRIMYYLLPLAAALVMLGLSEVALHRTATERARAEIGRWIAAFAPSVMSWATFAAGTVLLLSGATPITRARLGPLQSTVPLPLVEASHFAGSLAGAALLVLARGLQRRLDSAWWLSICLLGCGIVASLLKGFDYEEAVWLLLVVGMLLGCRDSFYRKGSMLHEPFQPGWIAAVVLALACSIWLGLFAHKHVDYSAELWWQFAFHGDAPRFLRASVGAVTMLLLFAVWKLLSPQTPATLEAATTDIETAATIVKQSPRTSANLALLGDKSFLFSENRTAFIMYAVKNRSWIAMGDPVGPREQRAELVWKYHELVDRYDGWPVFYQVAEVNLAVYLDQGLRLLKLGEEARVALPTFSLEGSANKGLRHTRNHCGRDGCEFAVVREKDVPALLPDMQKVSDAWLGHKHVAEKGFSLGYFDEAYLKRFPCAIVRRQGTLIAFANVWCGAGQEELSIDLMRYAPDAPEGVMEFLFIELMLWGKQQGFQWFNLGMSPLSGIESRPLAPLWNRAAGLVFRHGDHFYRFEGLRQYKQKFNPVWSPKYLASPGGLALPRILADVGLLIGKTSRPQTSK